MSGRNKAARILVAIGSIVLFASAALHSLAAYPRVSTALSASNLNARLRSLCAPFFFWWDGTGSSLRLSRYWLLLRKRSKICVLFCGAAVLVETALTLAFIGVFLGNEMIGSAPVLLMVGGLLSDTASKPQDAEKLAQLRIKACKKKWWEEHRLAKEAALGKPCDQCAGIVDTREMAGNLGALGEITQKKCPRPNFRISLILARFFKICGTEPSFTLYSRRGHHLRRRFYP